MYLPACRIIQMGVTSTGSRLHAAKNLAGDLDETPPAE
jgi:hypothetical protein